MNTKPLIAVVGADGFVGSHIAAALDASKVVYRSPQDGEVHITQAEGLVRTADIIFNAAGFRIRPGLTLADYQRAHPGATAAPIPCVHRRGPFLHMSNPCRLGATH